MTTSKHWIGKFLLYRSMISVLFLAFYYFLWSKYYSLNGKVYPRDFKLEFYLLTMRLLVSWLYKIKKQTDFKTFSSLSTHPEFELKVPLHLSLLTNDFDLYRQGNFKIQTISASFLLLLLVQLLKKTGYSIDSIQHCWAK
jgi:hypothetical protein